MVRVIGVLVFLLGGSLAYHWQQNSLLFVGFMVVAVGGLLLAFSSNTVRKQ